MYIGIQDDGVYTNLGLLLRIMGFMRKPERNRKSKPPTMLLRSFFQI